ncbi:hypothetical protein ACN47E_002241 [Coniothyrium glycines]
MKLDQILDIPVERAPPCFRFLDLPAEVRNMIYEQLVAVGKVIYSRPPDACSRLSHVDNTSLKPELSILRVCKQTHDEAETLYHGCNLFVLPEDWPQYSPFTPWDACARPIATRRLFSMSAFERVKHIKFRFDSNQPDPVKYGHQWQESEEKTGRSHFELTKAERREWIHQWYDINTIIRYRKMKRELYRFTGAMQYVEVDFTQAYCSGGCCRYLEFCLGSWVAEMRPHTLSVIGILPGEQHSFSRKLEKIMTLSNLHAEQINEEVNLEFEKAPVRITWDAYRIVDKTKEA